MRHRTTETKTERVQLKPAVLVLAPTGIDARLISQTLATAGIDAQPCATVEEVANRIGENTGAIVACEEALYADQSGILAGAVGRQPSWSDLPFLVMVAPLSRQFEGRIQEIRRTLGHVTLLERPIRPYSLLAAVDAALRTRQRQYEIRDHLLEREEAARALKHSEQRYRSLVEASSSVVWSADREGRLLPGNESWCKFTGQGPHACDLLSAIHEQDRPYIAREWWKAIHKREIFVAEFRLQKATGDHCTVLTKAVPVFERNGNVREWIGACTDIENQRRAEDALRHSERLAVAGRMAASIAHEINNPLEGVTNLLYLIRQSEDVSTIRSYVDLAQGELRRVVDVVAQTLSYYRQSSTPSEQSLAELVDSVLVLLGARLRSRNINLDKRYAEVPKVTCYPGEIKQVVANLLTNAMDAMQDGGRLIISVKRLGGVAGRPEAVRLTIADDGAGIPKQVKANLFQPFFSTKGNRGTGLGLWITSALLRKHGARLQIKSRTAPAPSGTVMSMVFPTEMPAEHTPGGRRTATVHKKPHDISDAPPFLHAAAVHPADSTRTEKWRNNESSDSDDSDIEDEPLARANAS